MHINSLVKKKNPEILMEMHLTDKNQMVAGELVNQIRLAVLETELIHTTVKLA